MGFAAGEFRRVIATPLRRQTSVDLFYKLVHKVFKVLQFYFLSSEPLFGCDLVQVDVLIKYLAFCLQPVANMLFVRLSLLFNLKCLNKKTKVRQRRWNKGLVWCATVGYRGPL